MSEPTLARARAGDQQAFRELTDPHRRELQLHCYRMLGSVQDAEDVLQETLVAAWRGLDRFEERSSLRAWLYRIATNRCINALRDAGRRPPPPPVAPFEPPAPTRYGEPTWLQPYPDLLLEGIADASPGPEAHYQAREAIELAFVAGLQQLPPRQRAALVLRDVLGFHTAEAAAMLESSEASVKGALQRARAALAQRRPAADHQRTPLPHSARERELITTLRRRVPGRRHRQPHRAADRRRVAHHAPGPAPVPGRDGDRVVPARQRRLARWTPVPAGADARQHPARLRLLPQRRRGRRSRTPPG